jgi:hypothetical protein
MTGYHQVPRQTSFFQLTSELDPWAVKASSNGIKYAGWNHNKAPISPPSLFDEQENYTPPHTPPASPPTIAAIKKNLIQAQQFISTTSQVDPWTVVNKDVPPAVPMEEDLSPQNLYKTELCRSFMETNTCRYGVKCQFAHGRHELRPVMRHPKYKTEICKTFHTLGTCPYGIRCRFIHTRATDIPSDSSSNPSNNSSPNYTPPGSPPSLRSSPPQVLNWSTSWSSGERPLPPSPEDITVPDINDQQPTARRLPIFRKLC